MRNLALRLMYDGTDFHGWQVQPNGITVEEALDQLRAAIDEYRLQYPELFMQMIFAVR